MRQADVLSPSHPRSTFGTQTATLRPAPHPALWYSVDADVDRPPSELQRQARTQGDKVRGLGNQPKGSSGVVTLKSPSGPLSGHLEHIQLIRCHRIL
jgi:hypothetical protein